MIAAITYFYAKTSAYDALVLPQMLKLFVTRYGESVAGVILTRLTISENPASFHDVKLVKNCGLYKQEITTELGAQAARFRHAV